ncbi:DUF418 domain-containing protein [Saccharospirillum alexandrii]|uniref:DUF418 domain-containing protein n=1 Tax=Saccharospirillum alexandrii TaxID=2448477 RepID=UPI000FD7091A|nr:DUF418 domain-containing protein [Saccharospirillum alexandrii]
MKSERTDEVDFIRALALVGICIVNVPFMALPIENAFLVPQAGIDRMAAFFVESFFQLKFFLLFSFLFGWGFGVQEASAHRRGLSFRRFYFGRISALAVFGGLHAVLVFTGDILLLYALLGALLWQVRRKAPSELMKIAYLMVPVSLLSLSTLAILVDEFVLVENGLAGGEGYHLAGGFLAASIGRLHEWPATFSFLLLLQGPLAMGAFCTGLVAQRTGFFRRDSEGFKALEKYVPVLLVVAVPTNVLYGATTSGLLAFSREWPDFIGFIGVGIGAPALAAVYLYCFIRAARRFSIPRLLTLAGRNSLSVYIFQGVLTGLVFGGYGLGLFNEHGPFSLLFISVAIAFISIVCIGVYASLFGRGPLEPILRKASGF